MNIKFSDLTDIDLNGYTNYPDFPNLCIDSAWNKVEDRLCTDAELDFIEANFGDQLHELATDMYFGE